MKTDCGSFTMPIHHTVVTSNHTEKSMAKRVPLKLHGLSNFLGCVIQYHILANFVCTVFF